MHVNMLRASLYEEINCNNLSKKSPFLIKSEKGKYYLKL